MSLKAVLDKTAYDAMDASLKSFYAQEGDTYYLDAEGIEEHT